MDVELVKVRCFKQRAPHRFHRFERFKGRVQRFGRGTDGIHRCVTSRLRGVACLLGCAPGLFRDLTQVLVLLPNPLG